MYLLCESQIFTFLDNSAEFSSSSHVYANFRQKHSSRKYRLYHLKRTLNVLPLWHFWYKFNLYSSRKVNFSDFVDYVNYAVPHLKKLYLHNNSDMTLFIIFSVVASYESIYCPNIACCVNIQIFSQNLNGHFFNAKSSLLYN